VTSLADVLTLVAIDSVSGNEAVLCAHVEQRLRSNPHLEVVRIGDNVVARTSQGAPTRVVIAGHLDTVPGDASGARIEGDVLHGVGACDMKASLAGMLDLASSGEVFPVDVTWVFYAREEIARSASGLLEIARERPDLLEGEVAVVGEPTNGVVEAGCQGTLRVALTLRGRRAHVARAFTGVNAIHRLAPVLARVAAYEPRVITIDGCTYTEQLQAVHVSGGIANNVVPDEVVVTLNHRVAPDRDDVVALGHLRSLLGDTVSDADTIEVHDWAPAAPPALSNDHLARLVQATGQPALAKVGWTDVATMQSLGVPATNFGAGDPLLAHRSDEHVTASQLDAFVTTLSAWLRAGA